MLLDCGIKYSGHNKFIMTSVKICNYLVLDEELESGTVTKGIVYHVMPIVV